MRVLLSSLCGIVGAGLCIAVLSATMSLSWMQMLGSGIAIAALLGNHAHGWRVVRRAAVRSRIFLGGTDGSTRSPSIQGAPSRAVPAFESWGAGLRALRPLTNPMWISYAFLASWAVYEALGVSNLGRGPIEAASAGISEVSGTPTVATIEPDLRLQDAVGLIRGPSADDATVLDDSAEPAVTVSPASTVRLRPQVRVVPGEQTIDTRGT